MSDDEFGLTSDLETFLDDSPAPPPGRKGAKARAPHPVEGEENPDIPAPHLLSREDPDAVMSTMREQIRREVLAEVAKSGVAIGGVVTESPKGEQLEPEQALPGSGTLVHFIVDGFTIGGRVFYRGQEFRAPASAQWATMTASDQVRRFGQQYFRPGPWEGQEYNLDDPTLSLSERQRLADATRKRRESLAQYV